MEDNWDRTEGLLGKMDLKGFSGKYYWSFSSCASRAGEGFVQTKG
ncbi:MAG: hypothetical protein MjAS7_2090 [Metallosphaera javensis (ex Sakai et al. 2022)]|nr:MAG: hypothetical protein MjAS7_2090 [Metallosphaera javensis (ex Sakai et al. 2022)]